MSILIYNREKRHLVVQYLDKADYALELRGRLTMVGYESGSGKSLLCTYVERMNKADFPNGGEDVTTINHSCQNLERIFDCNASLIIIDEADRLFSQKNDLTQRALEKLNGEYTDEKTYLIFTRGVFPLYASPNNWGCFIRNENRITIKYKYNQIGW